MTEKNSFYRLTLGLPGSGRSEVSQGAYASLVLPAATNDYLDAVVTYVQSWNTIHAQLPDAHRTLRRIQRQLQQQYRMTEPMPNPTSGSVGIMKYGLQDGYYRVIVINRVDPTLVLVRFVDFGYTDTATKQLIHPISQILIDVPAQAFPVQMKLKHSIAGSMSFNDFRKYMRNAQVVIQLGTQIVDNSFAGTIYITDVNGQTHRISEAIESEMLIKRLTIWTDNDVNEVTSQKNAQNLPVTFHQSNEAKDVNEINSEMNNVYDDRIRQDNQFDQKHGDEDKGQNRQADRNYGGENEERQDQQVDQKYENEDEEGQNHQDERNYEDRSGNELGYQVARNYGGENENRREYRINPRKTVHKINRMNQYFNQDPAQQFDPDDDPNSYNDRYIDASPGDETVDENNLDEEIEDRRRNKNDREDLQDNAQIQDAELNSLPKINENVRSQRKKWLRNKKPNFKRLNHKTINRKRLPKKEAVQGRRQPGYKTVAQYAHSTAPGQWKSNNISHDFRTLLQLRAVDNSSGTHNTRKASHSAPQISTQLVWIIFVSVLMLGLVIACFVFALLFTRKWQRILRPNAAEKNKLEKVKSGKNAKDVGGSSIDSSSGYSETGTISDASTISAEASETNRDTASGSLGAEDLGSVIGLMAFGSLKDDIKANLRKKRMRRQQKRQRRQHAGRSTVRFNMTPTLRDSIQSDSKISESEDDDEDKTASSDSTSDQESLTTSEYATYESTRNDNRSSWSSTNDTESTDDYCLGKTVHGSGVRKDDRNKEIVIAVNEVDRKPSSNNALNTIKDATGQSKNRAAVEADASSPMPPHIWIRANLDAVRESTNDSYDSIQQNSTLHLNLVAETSSVHREPSSHSIFAFSDEELRQNTCQYADSVHSSDFEIPSYLNIIPTLSESHQTTYQQTPNTRTTCQQPPLQRSKIIGLKDVFQAEERTGLQSEPERTNSTQVLSQDQTNNWHRPWSIRSTRMLSTPQVENVSQRIYHRSAGSKSTLTSRQTEQRTQTHPKFGKPSTSQHDNQDNDEANVKAVTSFGAPPRQWVIGSPALEDGSDRTQKHVKCCLANGKRVISPPLSKIVPHSSWSRVTEENLSLRRLELPEAEYPSSVEEALKMKMNISLMPNRYRSPSALDRTPRAKYRTAKQKDSKTSRSVSSVSTTTYESTRDAIHN